MIQQIQQLEHMTELSKRWWTEEGINNFSSEHMNIAKRAFFQILNSLDNTAKETLSEEIADMRIALDVLPIILGIYRLSIGNHLDDI